MFFEGFPDREKETWTEKVCWNLLFVAGFIGDCFVWILDNVPKYLVLITIGIMLGVILFWLAAMPGCYHMDLTQDMRVQIIPMDCTWKPPGTVTDGYGFPCGDSSPTGWCRGTSSYNSEHDRCNVRYCAQYEEPTRWNLISEELAHCQCERTTGDYDYDHGVCFQRWYRYLLDTGDTSHAVISP